MRALSWLMRGCLLAMLLVHTPAQAARPSIEVLIIKSDKSQVYDEVVAQINKRLTLDCKKQASDCVEIKIQSFVANEAKSTYQSYDLVVTLGIKALRYAQIHLKNNKILNAMIPYEYAASMAPKSKNANQAELLLDQPISRVIELVRLSVAGAETIGVLYSAENQLQIDELKRQAAKTDLNIIVRLVEDEAEIGQKLSRLLQDIDVLLALPDIRIHNRSTVTNILLSSYRNRIPLIGFSAAYVRAGALAAVYSTPQDIGNHLTDIIERFSRQGKLQLSHRYPKYFSVSINRQVARSLELQLADESAIKQHLERIEPQ